MLSELEDDILEDPHIEDVDASPVARGETHTMEVAQQDTAVTSL